MWEYYLGGYQVVKKWLSYREDKILGRALKPDEAWEVMNMARRLAAIVLLQPALDENYRSVKAATYTWPDAAILTRIIHGGIEARRASEVCASLSVENDSLACALGFDLTLRFPLPRRHE